MLRWSCSARAIIGCSGIAIGSGRGNGYGTFDVFSRSGSGSSLRVITLASSDATTPPPKAYAPQPIGTSTLTDSTMPGPRSSTAPPPAAATSVNTIDALARPLRESLIFDAATITINANRIARPRAPSSPYSTSTSVASMSTSLHTPSPPVLQPVPPRRPIDAVFAVIVLPSTTGCPSHHAEEAMATTNRIAAASAKNAPMARGAMA